LKKQKKFIHHRKKNFKMIKKFQFFFL